MIARIDGLLVDKTTEKVIIDVQGVGYEVRVPLSTYYKLPDINDSVRLNIHTCHREDAIELYGFLTFEEKGVFQMLLGVSGVGPKLARNILSGISVEDFNSSIASEDVVSLVKVPGLGKKTAERLILELKEKVKESVLESSLAKGEPALSGAIDSDVVSALVNLGYKSQLAREAVSRAAREVTEPDSFEILLKDSLQILAGK
ncbi:MAG: Holliday junction branch migration protein RuvA [Thermodesulfobacteriota bacterium]